MDTKVKEREGAPTIAVPVNTSDSGSRLMAKLPSQTPESWGELSAFAVCRKLTAKGGALLSLVPYSNQGLMLYWLSWL